MFSFLRAVLGYAMYSLPNPTAFPPTETVESQVNQCVASTLTLNLT